jgi:D-alanine--poly(phosphoribitol) ligase subunit 1
MRDVLDRFLSHSEQRPDHPAVVEDGRTVTYGQLAETARRMAAAMGETADAPRVLIHLPRGADAYAAMFATALAGGVYAPTNVEAPAHKQRLILERFDPHVVISSGAAHAELLGGNPGPPLVDVAALPETGMKDRAQPNPLAYVIFTSGSTGQPKGVAIPRAALAHYAAWALRAMAVTPSDRWSQHPNIAFDLSVLDIYGALCGGATLFPLVGAKDRLMPATAIARHRLTIFNVVPSIVGLMMQAGQVTAKNLSTLRLMTFCGEPLLPGHLEAIFAARPDLLVHNTYGPTEATVSCTLLPLTADNYREACRATVAIGEAIEGMDLRLEGGDNPHEGELVLSGPQLATGYWNDPEATGKAFRGATYHTGDWAERVDGHLYFQNRLDSQVKIHGHRLQLEEVEAAIRQCGIVTARVLLIEGALHGFLEGEADVERLRTCLGTFLENHAIPTAFHLLPSLPRNANGKIDAKALVADYSTDEQQ